MLRAASTALTSSALTRRAFTRRTIAPTRAWYCRVMSVRSWILSMAAITALVVSGCAAKGGDDLAGLGFTGANSSPPAGVYLPIQSGDLASVQERGLLLMRMERALRLGYEQGVDPVGMAQGDIVLPIVDVDPGGRSAQVLFLRWSRAAAGPAGVLHPKYADRWLLVSMMLEPERVLDRELLHGKVEEGSATYHRAYALIEAASALRRDLPGEQFHLFTVAELVPSGNRRIINKVATRIYALSAEGAGPDLEVVVDAPKRSKPPVVLSSTTVHPAGAIHANTVTLEVPQPAPATVARALLQGPSAGDFEVKGVGGAWSISSRTGRITRSGS